MCIIHLHYTHVKYTIPVARTIQWWKGRAPQYDPDSYRKSFALHATVILPSLFGAFYRNIP